MGTSRPTAITPAKFARNTPLCPVTRSRCGRARCPHRAAAPHRPRWLAAAVRGLASCVIAVSRCRAHHPCGAMLGRRVSRLAPYRHYAREIRTHRPVAITPAMPRRAPRAHPVAMPSRTLSRLHTQHRTPYITWAARWNIAPYRNGTRQWSEQRARARGDGNGTAQWGRRGAVCQIEKTP